MNLLYSVNAYIIGIAKDCFLFVWIVNFSPSTGHCTLFFNITCMLVNSNIIEYCIISLCLKLIFQVMFVLVSISGLISRSREEVESDSGLPRLWWQLHI